MERGMMGVKRRYDSSGRQEQAHRKRAAVLDAAERRFLDHGYGSTTVAAVAADAGVSVETIYKTFGSKAGLVTAIHERGLAGRGSVPAPRRSDDMQGRESDPRQIIRNWGTLTTEVAPLVCPILLLIRSSADSDPDMARLLVVTDQERLRRMRRNARTLTPHLRPDITSKEAADILWTYSSPDLYDLLVIRRRWRLVRYGRFVADSMIAELLP
jgi:AcrR family transcriptional regulator